MRKFSDVGESSILRSEVTPKTPEGVARSTALWMIDCIGVCDDDDVLKGNYWRPVWDPEVEVVHHRNHRSIHLPLLK